MNIDGKNEIELKNILLGEVWVCSGQSNMQWTVSNSNNSEQEISNANFSRIRLFTVPQVTSVRPKETLLRGEWLECSPATIPDFSAVGYFFGRELYNTLNVPIGLIHTSWGGTNIETWTSARSISRVDEFKAVVEELKEIDEEEYVRSTKKKFDKLMAEFGETKGGLVDGKALWADPALDETTWKDMELPQLWERAGLDKLDGVVWFRKTVDVPAEIAAKGGELHLGKIDDSDITWINGHKIGEMIEKYNEPRIYEIEPGILKGGKNVIAVRVEDYRGGGGLYGNPDDMFLAAGDFHLSLVGSWKYRISPQDLSIDMGAMGPNDKPTLLFNAMIHPIMKYNVRGAIWYQGEANADRAYSYRTLMPLMIEDWRFHFQNPDMAFLIVQLANFMQPSPEPAQSAWAELREAQLKSLEVANTGMAVAIDIGEADDIHPRNKQDVGYRLSLWARKLVYGEDIVSSGPLYKGQTIEGDRIRLTFTNVGQGLCARDKYGYLKGFTIAGEDQKFVWAKAIIENNTVVVYSEKVPTPVAVRYAWADNPDDANLYNKDGLPASPFRTDEWPGITR
jgi:sialate O-acetylesterase